MNTTFEKPKAEGQILVRLRRRAMGCLFELALAGHDEDYLTAAGAEALDILEPLERQLSVFIPDSEICYLNACAWREPVRVEARLYKLLKLSARLSEETEGAFDITSGPLVRLWGFAGGGRQSHIPLDKDIRDALKCMGFRYVLFDDEWCTVKFLREGMEFNLGGIGKGYAIDEIASFLVERGVTSGLIHAGTSTIYALGCPPGEEGWKIGIRSGSDSSEIISTITLKNRALSTSSGYEQYVELDGLRYSHIIDPRTGFPAEGLLSASAITSSATLSDALSTAFFVLGVEGTRDYCKRHSDVSAVLAQKDGSCLQIAHSS